MNARDFGGEHVLNKHRIHDIDIHSQQWADKHFSKVSQACEIHAKKNVHLGEKTRRVTMMQPVREKTMQFPIENLPRAVIQFLKYMCEHMVATNSYRHLY